VKLVTFHNGGRTSIGAVSDRGVVDLGELVPSACPQDMLTALIGRFDELRERIDALVHAGPALRMETLIVGASVPAPGKVLCVMRNRPALAQTAHPYAYLKCSLGAVATGQVLRLPRGETELWHEPELAVVVRGPARNVPRNAWRTAVFGYTGFLDVIRPSSMFTAASGAGDWWKSWDTPWAVGPWIVPHESMDDPGKGLTLSVTQASGTVEVADPDSPPLPELIEFLSSVMTLHTGDLIACGAHASAVTPASSDSRVRLTLPAIGSLTVEVRG
jgi:2-keto-4-pentenoate hydratase/2-oxohepta-3-ene-1,7-dioic acid hydratase in catechol pathway